MVFVRKHPFLLLTFVLVVSGTLAAQRTSLPDMLRNLPAGAVLEILPYPSAIFDGNDFDGEAAKLLRENKNLRAEMVFLEELRKENGRLRNLLNLTGNIKGGWQAARVVAASPSPFSYKLLILNRGKNDGIREGMPVVTGNGKGGIRGEIVGRILKSHSRRSQAILISDPISSVDAFTQRTGQRGTVKGSGGGCFMDYVIAGADVRPGDVVLSSGRDGIYPRGMIVGTIGGVGEGSSLKKLEVIPAANPDAIEEVIVLTEHKPQ